MCITLQLMESCSSRSKGHIIPAARPWHGLQRRTLTLTKAGVQLRFTWQWQRAARACTGDFSARERVRAGMWKVDSNCVRLTRSHIPSSTSKVLLWRKKIAKPSEAIITVTIFINQTGSQKTFSGGIILGAR